jgi:hypothetical protein
MATNPFFNNGGYGWGGSGQNAWDTPFVRDYLSPETPGGEYERFLSTQGYGGFDRRSLFARSLSSRANTGFQAAQLNNPLLTYRDYLNQNLGSDFFDNAWNAATPDQRGETPNRFAGRARTIGRA